MDGGSTKRVLGRVVCTLWLAGCADSRGELVVEQDSAPLQPMVTIEATPQMRAAPSRAGVRQDGACATQADCRSGEVCVATSPADAECVAQSERPELRAPRPGPLGQPAPPIGLLDGQAIRDHAERSMP